MFGFITSATPSSASAQAVLTALDRSLAVIEFSPDGTVITANPNFLKTMGYELAEIRGKHHSLFVTPEDRNSAAYRSFWTTLARGEHQSALYKRIAKNGQDVWIEATYNPVRDAGGRIVKIIKFATDVSARQREYADLRGKVNAIAASQAVIEFQTDGTILTANDNFLSLLGYRLDDIQGRHHRMFVAEDEARSAEYRAFWEGLNTGTFQTGQYRRLGKNGKVIWIQASYNPIHDLDGRLCKVVKFATDITDQITLLDRLKTLIDTNFVDIDRELLAVRQATNLTTGASTQTRSAVESVAASAEELPHRPDPSATA